MNKIFFIYPLIFLFLFLDVHAQEEWLDECKSSTTIKNYTFTFPSELDIDKRKYYIQKNLDSINECLALIEEDSFTDSVCIVFLKDRTEMEKYLGWPASGMAYPDRKVMFCIVAEKTPIKHEWMHMITMLKWGTPSPSLTWLNEGLATYADKCLVYPNEKIYRLLIQEEKLIEADDLVNYFYQQNDVIAYFQAAYLVEYLLVNYEISKFKKLWQNDINQFQEIYGLSLAEVIEKINITLTVKYPAITDFNWEEIEKGCY